MHLNISRDPPILSILASAVLDESSSIPSGFGICCGFDFNDVIEDTQKSGSTQLSLGWEYTRNFVNALQIYQKAGKRDQQY